MVEGQRRDLLNSNADSARWLEQVGFGSAPEVAVAVAVAVAVGDGHLLAQLRKLRDCIESMLAARRENRVADPAALNACLLWVVPQLVWEEPGAPVLDLGAAAKSALSGGTVHSTRSAVLLCKRSKASASCP
ncbi:putative stress-induced transcription regulator [compost metagenome]